MSKTGLSLIELVIGVSLASFVLVGVSVIAGQMARRQVEGIRSGTATGWALTSYTAMVKEIGDANVLAFPVNHLDEADQIIVCKNWSRITVGKLYAAAPMTLIKYCVDPTPPVAPETGFKLRRFIRQGNTLGFFCPVAVAVPVTCTPAGPATWGAWTWTSVAGFRLNKQPLSTSLVFQRDNSVGGVRMRYSIGQNASLNDPNPKRTIFNVSIPMRKQFSNLSD